MSQQCNSKGRLIKYTEWTYKKVTIRKKETSEQKQQCEKQWGISKVKLKFQASSPRACPKHENLADTSPGRSSAVLPSARKNCPAGCKPQLAGAYCPPLCACFQQIHMLSWLNPYLLPSGRTEKQQVSYYRQYSSLCTGSESKQ